MSTARTVSTLLHTPQSDSPSEGQSRRLFLFADDPPRGLVIEQVNGLSCPMAYCQRCGERITKISMAGIAYDWDAGAQSPIVVLCKPNGCLSAPEYRSLPWQELSFFLANLLFNLGLRKLADWKALERETRKWNAVR